MTPDAPWKLSPIEVETLRLSIRDAILSKIPRPQTSEEVLNLVSLVERETSRRVGEEEKRRWRERMRRVTSPPLSREHRRERQGRLF